MNERSMFDDPDAWKWLTVGLLVSYFGLALLIAGVWIIGEHSVLYAVVWAAAIVGLVAGGLTIAIRRRRPFVWLWSLLALAVVAIAAVFAIAATFES